MNDTSNGNNRGGAPLNNRNAIRHGLHATSLPKDVRGLENRLNKFRRHVEDAVYEQQGEVTLYHAAVIQSALRHERRARLLERWLKKESDGKGKGKKKLQLQDKMMILQQVSQATDARDKCLKALGLDKGTGADLWDFGPIPAIPGPDSPSKPADTAQDAPQRPDSTPDDNRPAKRKARKDRGDAK